LKTLDCNLRKAESSWAC